MAVLLAQLHQAPVPIVTFRNPYDTLAQGLVLENTAPGTALADLSSTGGFPTNDPVTITKTADPANKFSVTGNVLFLANTLNYDFATSHSVTIQAANSTGANTVTIVVQVGDVTAPSGLVVADQPADFGALTQNISGVWHPIITGSGIIVPPCDIIGGTLLTLNGKWDELNPTAVPNGWEIEPDGGLKKHRPTTGGVNITSGTLLCSYNGGAETALITINALADTYSVSSTAEINTITTTALRSVVAGKTILLRGFGDAGKYSRLVVNSMTYTSQVTIKGPTVWPPTAVITYKNDTVAASSISTVEFIQSHRITLEYLCIENLSESHHTQKSGVCFAASGSLTPNGIIIQKNEFRSNPCLKDEDYGWRWTDTDGDAVADATDTYYSPLDGYVYVDDGTNQESHVIYYRGAVAVLNGTIKNFTFRNNWCHDLWTGGGYGAQGFCRVHDNVFQRLYYDGLSLGQANRFANPLGPPEQNYEFYFARNVVKDICGSGAHWLWLPGSYPSGGDFFNPHPDLTQLAIQDDANGDWEGLVIEMNVLMFGDGDASSGHGIFQAGNENDPIESCIDNPLVRGNMILGINGGTHGITMGRIRDGRFYNNFVGSHTASTYIGEYWLRLGGARAHGTLTLLNNICGSYFACITPHDNTDASGWDPGDPIINYPIYEGIIDNRNLWLKDAPRNGGDNPPISQPAIPWASVFVGPTFEKPLTVSDFLARWTIKPLGPADRDNSGGPSVNDAGPRGSGYCTYPTNMHLWGATAIPDNAGYVAPNPAYEVP